jgi:hypothetical protein
MTREVQAPEIELNPDKHTDSIERHPAFAQIGASRVSGSAYLYGSDFEHQHFVIVSIARSELHRGLSNDWHHEREELIQVAMSEAQWATFVSSMNQGSGVPCTLERLAGAGVPQLPAPLSRQDQFKGELRDTLKDGMDALAALRADLVARKMPKTVLDHLDKCVRELSQNIPFVAQQFGEHVEGITEAAKIEMQAYISHTINRAGLTALQAPAPIKLPKEKE